MPDCKHPKLIRVSTGYRCSECDAAVIVTLPPQVVSHDFVFNLLITVRGNDDDCKWAEREEVHEALTEILMDYDSFLTVTTKDDEGDELEVEFEVTNFDLTEVEE